MACFTACAVILRTVAVARIMQRFQRFPLVQLPFFNQVHQLKVHLCLIRICYGCQFLTEVAQCFLVSVDVIAAVMAGEQVQIASLRRFAGHLFRFGQLLVHIFAYCMVELADGFDARTTHARSECQWQHSFQFSAAKIKSAAVL